MKPDKSERSVKTGLSQFLQSKSNAFMARWLPYSMVQAYISILGRYYHTRNPHEYNVIKHNLTFIYRRLFGCTPADDVIQKTFTGIYAHYHEKLFMAYAEFGKVCRFMSTNVQLESKEVLDAAMRQERGVIMVTGHYGAVEFLPLSLAVNDYPVTMIVCFKTPQLKAALNSRCRHVPITLLDAKNDKGVIFNAFKALKRNQILITECDEFDAWNVNGKQQTSFLGLPTPLDRSLDMLQRRYRSPAVMSLVRRESGRRFAMQFHDLQQPGTQADAAGVAQKSLAVLEAYIRQSPDQWYQWKDVSHLPGVEPYKAPATASPIDTRGSLPIAGPAMQPHTA